MINDILFGFTGELSALSCGLFWAVASVLYRNVGETLSPIKLNLAKGILAILFLVVAFLLSPSETLVLESFGIGIFMLSGAIGIGFGDSVYFSALNKLGARLALLLGMLAPPFTAIFGLVFLNENLSFNAWIGILLTVSGVVWVITEKSENEETVIDYKKGIFFGVLAALSQATGAIFTRFAFTETVVSPLQSSAYRLLGGFFVLFVWSLFAPQKGSWVSFFTNKKAVLYFSIAVFLGTFLGIWLQQISLFHTDAGIAQTLFATSPLFILGISLILGRKVSLRAFGGVVVSLVGIFLLFTG